MVDGCRPNYRRALEAMLTFDRRASLGHIHVPTLLVAGEFDRNAPPRVMKKMAKAIVGSTYLEMAGIGHLQNLEAPEQSLFLSGDYLTISLFRAATADYFGR